jgi:hypothetical protein
MQLDGRGVAVLALAGVVTACQAGPPDQSTGAAATARPPANAAQEDRSSPDRITPIDWAGAGDCLGQLRLLHAAAAQGRLDAAHAPPFAVVSAPPTTGFEWIHAPTVPLVLDLPLQSFEDQGAAAAAAPCLLLVEPPEDLSSGHRVVEFQNVASEYQSGSRSERNPDYDAAQARLKEAARASRSGAPDVLRVGDPLLDLVGLLVGGVISTFSHLDSDGDLVEAMAAVKETPRSREHPVYRAYEFERSMVRAGKEAIVPVALRDLRRGHVWRTELRQREMRQFAVLDGLDPRDRDYEQHRAGAFSWQEFEHWQSQPPQLPVSALVAALAEMRERQGAPSTSEPELVADAAPLLPPSAQPDARAAPAGESSASSWRAAIEPGAGPDAPSAGAGRPDRNPPGSPPSTERGASREGASGSAASVFAAGLDPRMASVVRLDTDSRRGAGFYLKPRLVVTTADLAGAASVIDVIASDGEKMLGLVVHTDPARNLAVVHVAAAPPRSSTQRHGMSRTPLRFSSCSAMARLV